MLSKEIIELVETVPLQQAISIMASVYPGRIVFSSSLGQEDQVITDAIFQNQLEVKVFTIDTGRLFPETYDLLDKTVARYNKAIEVYFPEATDVEQYVNHQGMNGFYESVDSRKDCCHVRKVKPLNRALSGAKVWVTGLRSGQSLNRQDMRMIEWDEQRELYKFNPLIHWSFDDVINYIKTWSVPTSTLHEKGFISIGCAPCTRAIEPGADPRAGRWWWESSQKECGLHQTLVK